MLQEHLDLILLLRSHLTSRVLDPSVVTLLGSLSFFLNTLRIFLRAASDAGLFEFSRFCSFPFPNVFRMEYVGGVEIRSVGLLMERSMTDLHPSCGIQAVASVILGLVPARYACYYLVRPRPICDVKYIVKEVEDYLKTYSSAGMGISWRDNSIKQNDGTNVSFELKQTYVRVGEICEQLAELLTKEVGGNHAQGVGFSTDGFATTTTMRKLHLIWVTARMHIEVYRYPAWSDVIEIETWVQGDGKIGTRRDWILKDYANGEVIGRATRCFPVSISVTDKPSAFFFIYVIDSKKLKGI
nr:oleoyl-acyl carrier protein thioesterase, chloroplastic-like [Tanacetum cinerariifolium]